MKNAGLRTEPLLGRLITGDALKIMKEKSKMPMLLFVLPTSGD
jgi:hypothetical protein